MKYATPQESRDAGVAYHMVPAEVWDARRNDPEYYPEGFDADGFIHTTNGLDELVAVGNRFYIGDPREYMALILDVASIQAPVRYDDLDQLFPHIYGPLNPSAVVGTLRAMRNGDGTFRAFVDA